MGYEYSERHCIFCGKNEDSFENGNMFTIEHIVPYALGNRHLKIADVCKQCNSGLGTYVDNYVIDSLPVQLLRRKYHLVGQSGRIPNPFAKGKDKDGHTVYLDDSFKPRIQEYLEKDKNGIKFVAPQKDQLKRMIQKTLSRKGYSSDIIDAVLLEADKVTPKCFQEEIEYTIEIDFNRYMLEALKIGYEFAVYLLGNKYERDPIGEEIRAFLQKSINGDYAESCPHIPWVTLMDQSLFRLFISLSSSSHFVLIHPNIQGFLCAEVSLLAYKGLSFSVLLSEKAIDYDVSDTNCEIIPFLSTESEHGNEG